MSKNELTPEVLTKLENAALGTLAKKAKEGDPVAARALLDRVDKIRQQPRGGRIPLVTDPAQAKALIAHAQAKNRPVPDDEIIPLPPVPGIDLEPGDYLEGIYMIMAWAVTNAARRGSIGQVLKTLPQMRKVYDDLTKIREPGRRSIWEGTPEERAQRFAASAATASTELLEACAAELRHRAAR